MSTNCLITKLKSSVDNQNLPKYGVFELTTNQNLNDSILWIRPCLIKGHTGTVTYKIYGSEVPESSLVNYTDYLQGELFKVSMTAGSTILVDKYNTTKIGFSDLGLKGIDNYTSLEEFRSNSPSKQHMSIKDDMKSINLKYIALIDGDSDFKIGTYRDILEVMPNIEEIFVGFTNASIFGGTIADVAQASHLHTVIDSGNSRYMLNQWTSTTLRPSEYPIIALPQYGGGFYFASRNDAKNFIINMANCQPSDLCPDKSIYLGGLDKTDPEVAAAIETLSQKGYTVHE